mmetsp:Transcript_25663/g.47881  ORF Transcript_25663/g.47881 Transcript_25663/m.47881 type:complete len:101 (+) Transcript_25663:303-605(+)
MVALCKMMTSRKRGMIPQLGKPYKEHFRSYATTDFSRRKVAHHRDERHGGAVAFLCKCRKTKTSHTPGRALGRRKQLNLTSRTHAAKNQCGTDNAQTMNE